MSDMATATFLLEVGVEEIPARMAPPAAADLKRMFQTELEAARLAPSQVSAFHTPRRLVLVAEGVSRYQPDQVVEKRGPAARIAFDAEGRPTKAGQGFARSQGLDLAEVGRVEMEGTEYLFVRKEEKGEEAAALLPAMIVKVLNALRFPKSMRWGSLKQGFVRPVHWLVALLDEQVLEFEFGGISSSNVTRGHRFMGSRTDLTVSSPNGFARALKENFVMLAPDERRRRIQEKSAKVERELGVSVIQDDALLDEVVNLVEYPVVASGTFDEKFLEMPPEVLVTSMKNHQKYFALTRRGELCNRFLVVNNTKAVDRSLVVRGNQRVLSARLEDALFFFRDDQKRNLEAFVDGLAGQTFLAGLGSMKDKSERISRLACALAEEFNSGAAETAERAGTLCKADLATEMVGEFPELQGVMGRVYALSSGEEQDVADAIFEHYLPRFSGDELPQTPAGVALALADRLDTVAGCFHLKLIPTATKDPYGLRRAILACLRILEEQNITVPSSRLITMAIENYGETLDRLPHEVADQIMEFARGRLRNFLTAEHATEVVDACLAAGFEFPWDVREKCRAIEKLRGREDYESLITAFKRVINITRKEKVGDFDPSMLTEDAEGLLWDAFTAVSGKCEPLFAARDFSEVLAVTLELKAPIDRYFDDVMVMCEDSAVRSNRLAMLSQIGKLFLRFADFTKILV